VLYWYTRTHTDAEEALVAEGKHLFALVMNRKAAAKTLKHISLYTSKKLLSKFESVKVPLTHKNLSKFETLLRFTRTSASSRPLSTSASSLYTSKKLLSKFESVKVRIEADVPAHVPVSIRQHTSAYVSIRQHTSAEHLAPYELV
jgi:hypothetical protein